MTEGKTRECFDYINNNLNRSKTEILNILYAKFFKQDESKFSNQDEYSEYRSSSINESKKSNIGLIETVNHILAYNYMHSYNGPLTEAIILECHSILMDGILPDAGKYRCVNVHTGTGYVFPNPTEVPHLMSNLIQSFNTTYHEATVYGKASYIVYKLGEIHPFADGNGRISRLIGNWILRVYNDIPFPISLTQTKGHAKKYKKCIKHANDHLSDSSHMSVLILIITYNACINANTIGDSKGV